MCERLQGKVLQAVAQEFPHDPQEDRMLSCKLMLWQAICWSHLDFDGI